MQKIALYSAVLLILASFFVASSAKAALFEPNNKVGIGMAGLDDKSIVEAANMVNGNNGSMGYVTIVIQEGDRDLSKWQGICNKLRTARLIPIFRLATRPEGGNWRRPNSRDAIEWASFLNRLNCTTTTTYIQPFNEPNHAAEWGGAVDPQGYADTMLFFTKTLKNANPNFFLLAGGLDQAAPQQSPNYYDAEQFWREVLQAQPSFFDNFDGLATHCYPNPGFSASVNKRGRNSIDCYNWELSRLAGLGVVKDLPIFITETGWIGGAGNLAENYKTAYEQVWLPDLRVRAVTPFVLSYIGAPFEPFSFKKSNTSDTNAQPFHDQYYAVRDIPKVHGDPPQTERVNVLSPLPAQLVRGSRYSFQLWLKNTGQSILHKPDGYSIDFIKKPTGDFLFSPLYNVEPNDSTIVNLTLQVGDEAGTVDYSIGLFKNGQLKTVLFPWVVVLTDPPPMQMNLSIFPGRPYTGKATIQVIDENGLLLYEEKDVSFKEGLGLITQVKGVLLGQPYKIVALVDFYLPREQNIIVESDNTVVFEMLIPGDANNDGKFTIEDVFLMPASKQLYRSFLPSLMKPNLLALLRRG